MQDSEVCKNHPDRRAAAVCERYGEGMCLDCLEEEPECPDPEMYCKYRERCLVYFGYKDRQRELRKKAGEG